MGVEHRRAETGCPELVMFKCQLVQIYFLKMNPVRFMVLSLTCIIPIALLSGRERGGVSVGTLGIAQDCGGTYLAGEPRR